MIRVDYRRCHGCQVCVLVCPHSALTPADAVPSSAAVHSLQLGAPRIIDVTPTGATTLCLRQKVLPALEAGAAFAGREIVPQVLDLPAARAVSGTMTCANAAHAGRQLGVGIARRSRQRQ